MKQEEAKQSSFPELHHIGLVVKDLNKTIEYLTSLGIGPFRPSGRVPVTERNLRGKLVPSKLEMRFARLGQIELEVVQPIEGECIQMEFLKSQGEGIHHLGFAVDDIRGEMDKLTKQGIKIEQSGTRPIGGGFAFFKCEIPDFFIELTQQK
ncbi:VOC family protein [Chloroflexota bacterium]